VLAICQVDFTLSEMVASGHHQAVVIVWGCPVLWPPLAAGNDTHWERTITSVLPTGKSVKLGHENDSNFKKYS